MQDMYELARAVGFGLALGIALVAVRSARRWIRGEKLFPRVEKQPVPLKIWIFGTAFFGGFAGLSLVTASYAFAIAFGIAATLYAIGGVRYLVAPERRV